MVLPTYLSHEWNDKSLLKVQSASSPDVQVLPVKVLVDPGLAHCILREPVVRHVPRLAEVPQDSAGVPEGGAVVHDGWDGAQLIDFKEIVGFVLHVPERDRMELVRDVGGADEEEDGARRLRHDIQHDL